MIAVKNNDTIPELQENRDLAKRLREQSLRIINLCLDDVKTQHPLDLPQLVNFDRPDLGSSVPVSLYRTIRLLAFREVLGSKISSSILNISGRSIALKMNISTIQDMVDILRSFSIGKINIEVNTDDLVVISADECATCSGLPDIGQPLCCFEGGFAAGALQSISGMKYKVTETHCWGLGDRICRWQLVKAADGMDSCQMVDTLDVVMALAEKAALSVDTSIAIRQKNHQLREANKKFKEMEQLKKDLTDMIVHDMRVPLTTVMGSLEMISELAEDKLSAQEKKMFNIALSSSQNLMSMVNDLLDISRLEDRKLILRTSPVSMYAVLEQAISNTEISFRKKKISLSFNAESNLPDVDCDRERMVRVFVNILMNAVRHSPSGGTVAINAGIDQDSGMLAVKIIDNGEGIPKEYHNRIFDKFAQIDSSRSRRRNSCGLGLTFCKLIIEALGGTIAVESEPGQGCMFKVSLPLTG